MSAEENRTTQRRFFEEVINQKHLVVIDDIYAANFVSHSMAPDREGVKVFVSTFHAAFPDGHISIDQMIAEGDFVAVRTTFRGTHTGELMGIPPTNRHVVVPCLDMIRYVNGKIAEHWGGPDQMSLMQQLGVVPPRG